MQHEIIHVGPITVRFLLDAAATNGAVAMFEFTVPVGARVPVAHSHRDYDETVYGLEGECTFMVDGREVHIGPGESQFIPRGAVHGFDNQGQTDVKALAVITPALLGPDFFKEVAALVSAGGPPDIEKLKAIYAAHGLVPAMPH